MEFPRIGIIFLLINNNSHYIPKNSSRNGNKHKTQVHTGRSNIRGIQSNRYNKHPQSIICKDRHKQGDGATQEKEDEAEAYLLQSEEMDEMENLSMTAPEIKSVDD